VDIVEESPILQDTSACYELPQTFGVQSPEFRTRSEDGFSFRREIESIFRLMIVKATQPIPISEECHGSPTPIGEETVKQPVQSRKKARVIELMPLLPGLIFAVKLGEFFARSDQDHVPAIALYWHCLTV
jgi:hypothetical protein